VVIGHITLPSLMVHSLADGVRRSAGNADSGTETEPSGCAVGPGQFQRIHPQTFTVAYDPQNAKSGVTYTGTVSIANAPLDTPYSSNELKQVTVRLNWTPSTGPPTRAEDFYHAFTAFKPMSIRDVIESNSQLPKVPSAGRVGTSYPDSSNSCRAPHVEVARMIRRFISGVSLSPPGGQAQRLWSC